MRQAHTNPRFSREAKETVEAVALHALDHPKVNDVQIDFDNLDVTVDYVQDRQLRFEVNILNVVDECHIRYMVIDNDFVRETGELKQARQDIDDRLDQL